MASDDGTPNSSLPQVTHIPEGPAHSGWNRMMDVSFVRASEREVVIEMPISEKHLQPMGIVHGGVYCGLVETVCSVGGFLAASKHGLMVVGVDNHTSFLRANRGGTLTATGNSFAAPHISGLVARILGKHPGLTPFQLKTVLHAIADNAAPEDTPDRG